MGKKIYKSSQDWYKNKHVILVSQRNILLLMVILLTGCLFFSTIFIHYISSNKSLEPYVIEIEKSTGKPKIVKTNALKTITDNQIVKKYFVSNFINAMFYYRKDGGVSELEKYSSKKNQEIVRNFASEKIGRIFRTMNKKYAREKVHSVEVKIKTIQFPAQESNVCEVRILRVVKGQDGKVKKLNELVEINFKIDHMISSTEKQKEINPIGFIIVDYRLVEESFEY
ncbi:type IV secretion system protein [Flavobacteriaceae bacterium]|nr:type IV secretion system protein [Flavobacteriaceae bacterium]